MCFSSWAQFHMCSLSTSPLIILSHISNAPPLNREEGNKRNAILLPEREDKYFSNVERGKTVSVYICAHPRTHQLMILSIYFYEVIFFPKKQLV